MTLTPLIYHLAILAPYDFLCESDQRQVATAATRWIACDDDGAAHPPSGEVGSVRFLYESHQRQVSTAATRWIACDDADAAHLPSGDIGYGRLRSF